MHPELGTRISESVCGWLQHQVFVGHFAAVVDGQGLQTVRKAWSEPPHSWQTKSITAYLIPPLYIKALGSCDKLLEGKYRVDTVVKYVTSLMLTRALCTMVARDTAMFALFLSTFLSSYKGVLCLMRRIRKSADPNADRLNAFVAGAVAGLSLIIDKDKRRRQSIMMYLLTRAIQFTGAFLMKQWAIARKARANRELAELKEKIDREGFAPDEPRQLVVKKKWDDHLAKFLQRWAGVFVMVIANVQIIYAFLFHADTLPKSYFGFLLTHSGWKGKFGKMASPLAHTIGETVDKLSQDTGPICMPEGTTSREFIAKNVSSNVATIIPPNIRHKYIMCALQHPLEPSCSRDKLNLFRDEYIRALKLYVPLNVVSILLVYEKIGEG